MKRRQTAGGLEKAYVSERNFPSGHGVGLSAPAGQKCPAGHGESFGAAEIAPVETDEIDSDTHTRISKSTARTREKIDVWSDERLIIEGERQRDR